MKACIYSELPIKDKKGLPAFNRRAFPAHADDVETIYLNGDFPEIQELCKEAGIEVKPFSALKSTKSETKSKEVKTDGTD